MNNYDERFNNKISSFLYAQVTYPHVMKHEFETVLRLLEDNIVTSSDKEIVFVNIPADILFERYLYSLYRNDFEYIPYELNKSFAYKLGFEFTSIVSIDLPCEKADIMLSLAALHHFNLEDRQKFYKECRRILKPDGVLLVGDVLQGSKQDKWLNEYVNDNNSNGHRGLFFTEDEKLLLEAAGFQVDIQYKEYTWNFESLGDMCEYCINLFGLNKVTNKTMLLEDIDKYLNYTVNEDLSCQFNWSLIYFKSTVCRV